MTEKLHKSVHEFNVPDDLKLLLNKSIALGLRNIVHLSLTQFDLMLAAFV